MDIACMNIGCVLHSVDIESVLHSQHSYTHDPCCQYSKTQLCCTVWMLSVCCRVWMLRVCCTVNLHTLTIHTVNVHTCCQYSTVLHSVDIEGALHTRSAAVAASTQLREREGKKMVCVCVRERECVWERE